MSGPVEFAPGRYVRLKNNTAGLPAGTRGMVSGRVLTRPEDRGKLEIVFRSYIPESPEYGKLKLPREALEWDTEEAPEKSARDRPQTPGFWRVALACEESMQRFERVMRDLTTAGVGMEERAQAAQALIQKVAEDIERRRQEGAT